MRTGKPEVDFPGGDPPAELQITEIWEGNGSAPVSSVALQAETRSQTKMRVSPGAITFPAPRSP